jgi:hypothetical protein
LVHAKKIEYILVHLGFDVAFVVDHIGISSSLTISGGMFFRQKGNILNKNKRYRDPDIKLYPTKTQTKIHHDHVNQVKQP